nr:LOW QUALITY PROTEIN: carcinoembryonic antigen-related cell adhesion molecule 6-like [Bubalus bubalis]
MKRPAQDPGHHFPIPHTGHNINWSLSSLLISLSTFWTPPTTAQLTIETVPPPPPPAAEVSDVLLLAHNVTENPLGYAWHRGDRVDNTQLIASYRVDTNVTTKGPAHSGRETLYPNRTLLIQNVTQKDTGSYTLLLTKDDLQTEGKTGHLCIYTVLPTPVITSNNSNPREHKDTVVLTCRSETRDIFYFCSINNQSLHNSTELELCEGNRTLTMFNVTRNDTGPYVSEAGNPENTTHGDPFTLNGLCQENSPALNREIVIVIMIGILVRLALVITLECFVFLKMARRYKWRCPMLILSPRLTPSQEERHPTLGFWAWLSKASPLPPRTFCLIHRPLLHQMLTWGGFPTPSASVHSSILAWRTPWTEKPGGPQSTRSRRVGCDCASDHIHTHSLFRKGPVARMTSESTSLQQPPWASLPSPRAAVPIYEELLYPNTDIYCQIDPKVDVVS